MGTTARQSTLALVSSSFALLAACGGGGGGTSSNSVVTLAITDGATDELTSFKVAIATVELHRITGATVGVLASPMTVDLVTLDDTSQILNVIDVPLGTYSSATVTLDFTNASAYLLGETTAATIVDGDGMALTGTAQLPVTLGGGLAATVGRNRILEIDFDLDQSVMVDAGMNTVTVEPAIVMRVDRADPKELIAVGGLQSVDVALRSLSVELQTFAGVPISTVDVSVTGTTVYQIDGVASQGLPSLTTLAGMPVGTWVQMYGTVDPLRRRIEATYIEAGTGTYNGGSDIIEGHVVGRIGVAGADPTLTILGRSNDSGHLNFQFNTTFTVTTTFTDTKVVRRGSMSVYDTDELNIGQRVRIFGSLAGTAMNATIATSVVRVQPTRVLGYANDMVGGGTLTVDVARIDLRPESEFTWAEGGLTPPDPAALTSAVGALANGLMIEAATPVEVRGYFPPIDDAAHDFVATSVTNRDLAPSLILVHDRSGGLVLTPTVTATDMLLGIAGAPAPGELAVVDRGFVGSVSLPVSPTPRILPAGPLGVYSVRDRQTGAMSVHFTFSGFAQALNLALAVGADIYNLGAAGQYDDIANTMSAFLVIAVVD